MLVDRSAPVEEVSAKRNNVVTNSPTSCASHVRSVLTLVLKTSDGSLDEELAVEVQAFSTDVVEVKGNLPVGALNGTLSVAEGVQLGVYVSFEAGGYRGNILASEKLPTSSKNSSSGRVSSIATWKE
jgi:hypothetical protein